MAKHRDDKAPKADSQLGAKTVAGRKSGQSVVNAAKRTGGTTDNHSSVDYSKKPNGQ